MRTPLDLLHVWFECMHAQMLELLAILSIGKDDEENAVASQELASIASLFGVQNTQSNQSTLTSGTCPAPRFRLDLLVYHYCRILFSTLSTRLHSSSGFALKLPASLSSQPFLLQAFAGYVLSFFLSHSRYINYFPSDFTLLRILSCILHTPSHIFSHADLGMQIFNKQLITSLRRSARKSHKSGQFSEA